MSFWISYYQAPVIEVGCPQESRKVEIRTLSTYFSKFSMNIMSICGQELCCLKPGRDSWKLTSFRPGSIPSPSQIQKGKGNLASGLSLKSYWPPTPPPYNFTRVWVKVHGSDRSPKYIRVLGRCPKFRWTGRGRTHGCSPCHVQVEHYQKKSQNHKPKSKIPGLLVFHYKAGNWK